MRDHERHEEMIEDNDRRDRAHDQELERERYAPPPQRPFQIDLHDEAGNSLLIWAVSIPAAVRYANRNHPTEGGWHV